MKFRLFLFLNSLVATALCGNEYRLMDNGNPVCSIVIAKNAGLAEKHAAGELARYLGKISGGVAPEIGTEPKGGFYPVKLVLLNEKDNKNYNHEGFSITADATGITVSAIRPVGIIYGVYEILKRYGGIRWLLPGDDGEYFTVTPTIIVPDGKLYVAPSFRDRSFILVCVGPTVPKYQTWDWMLRNNMRPEEATQFIEKLGDKFKMRAPLEVSGECMTPIMLGLGLGIMPYKEMKATVERMFAEHPERFPIQHGKRTISRSATDPQPCTTNKDVIELISKHIIERLKMLNQDGFIQLSNNDLPHWCECAECRKLDPPYEIEKGYVSTRYWTLFNEVFARAENALPNLRPLPLAALAYQNYTNPPTGIKPVKGCYDMLLAHHRRCWKHNLEDPNCPVNAYFIDVDTGWAKTGVPFYTYECLYSAANQAFAPFEKSIVHTLRYYKKNIPGVIGMRSEITPPECRLSDAYEKEIATKKMFHRTWQAAYAQAYFLWNIDANYDKVMDEANRLFYGKGWEGGIKKFRVLMEEAFYGSTGCWGYGHAAQIGKFLDHPGAAEAMLNALELAEKAATADPDFRALAHVRAEAEFFRNTWLRAREEYLKNYQEIKVYEMLGKIKLDGVLDETDWKNADIISNFKNCDNNAPANPQTVVRITYDKDYVYFGFECFEPAPAKIKTVETKRDGYVYDDNDIEIFINPPILGARYFQMVFNLNGVLFDASKDPGHGNYNKEFDSGAEFASKIYANRWTAEARIPAKSLVGETFKTGEILKINIMRSRQLTDGTGEASTWSSGYPHNIDRFHPVSFAGKRQSDTWSRAELDTRLWKNGSFNELHKKPILYHWKVKNGRVPAGWFFTSNATYGGELEMLLHPASQDNYFLRFRSGMMGQDIFGKELPEKFRMTFRTRGKGEILFYMNHGLPKKQRESKLVKMLKINDLEWTTYNFEFDRPGTNDERYVFMMRLIAGGEIDIDDMFLVGK